MDYLEFRRHLGKAGLTINEFAALLQIQPSAVSNYSKKSSVPRAYAVLAVVLGDVTDRGIDFREALSRFELHITDSKAGRNVAQLADYRLHSKKPRKG